MKKHLDKFKIAIGCLLFILITSCIPKASNYLSISYIHKEQYTISLIMLSSPLYNCHAYKLKEEELNKCLSKNDSRIRFLSTDSYNKFFLKLIEVKKFFFPSISTISSFSDSLTKLCKEGDYNGDACIRVIETDELLDIAIKNGSETTFLEIFIFILLPFFFLFFVIRPFEVPK